MVYLFLDLLLLTSKADKEAQENEQALLKFYHTWTAFILYNCTANVYE